MKYLFIAEKNSLMKEVMNSYNNHQDAIIKKIGYIDFVALSGHVCTVYEPNEYDEWADLKWDKVDYPMIPNYWKIKPINDAGKKKILSRIKGCVNDYDGIIVGTDSDVEGYGIYYLLENYLGITKKKALRFIEHSLTDEEIFKSLMEMTDYHTDIIHKRFVQSFLMRSRADWLYGMNATRMVSVKVQELIATGRVKAPTIKLVYDNSMAIDNFKPEDYWNACMNYGTFISALTEDDKNPLNYKNEADIPNNIPLKGIIKDKKTERKKTSAPKLYDLSAIQSEAGQHYGYSPEETLEIVQSLYEKHKLLSYPRTQCRYVTYEKSKEFSVMIKNMSVFDEIKDIAASITGEDIKKVMGDKNVVNDKEVQKESHDALLPTSRTPKLEELDERERNICLMVYKRLLSQFLPKLEEDKTQIIIKHGEHDFIAKGKIVINQGWRILYGKSKDNIIPDVNVNDNIEAEELVVQKKTTKPPKRLTEATLLNAMINIASLIEDKELKKNLAESKGIGTPATRANIIKDIISRGYVKKTKEGLYITETGIKYINSIKTLDIVSPVFAAILETKIHKIQRGEIDYNSVYQDMIKDLDNMCRQIDEMPTMNTEIDAYCPNCSTKIKSDSFYYVCPQCGFKISKKIAGKEITAEIIKKLIDGETTKPYSFKKKDGSNFKAKLVLKDGEVQFDFNSGIKCPRCKQKDVNINKGGAFCDCGLKVFRNICGHSMSDAEIETLLTKNKVTGITNFKSKAGKIFGADIILDDDTAKLEFN